MEDFAVSSSGSSPRLERLIRKTLGKDTADKDYFYRTVKLSDSDFLSLTPSEKFIYAHQYPESYMQNCSYYTSPKGLTKLYANLPFITTGLKMSKRQIESLKINRDSSINYLRECIKKHDYIALGYKQTILELNVWEFVPFILSFESKLNTGKNESLQDTYLYTVLMRMMKDNDFPDFKKTNFYNKLYGSDAKYRETIDFTPDTRKQLVNLAENFYLWKTSETK